MTGLRFGMPGKRPVSALVSMCLALGVMAAGSPAALALPTAATPGSVPLHAVEALGRAQLTAIANAEAARRPTRSAREGAIRHRPFNESALESAKRLAASRVSQPARGAVSARSPLVAPTTPRAGAPTISPMALLLQAWPGPSATDEFGCCTPPDSTGAVGPTNYVETVNRLIAVYDRSGIQLSRADLGDFVGFGSLNTFDPQMQWDQVAGRWLYAADVVAGPGGNFLAFGWSKTADPSDLLNGWCLFGLNTGTHFNDFPKLGHDDTYATIGTNVFNDTVGAFETSNLWVYQKPALGDPNCPMSITIYSAADATNPLRNADGTLAFTPVPANTSDSSALGFVTAAHTPLLGGGGPQTKIMLWHISGSPGVPPTLTADGDLTVSVFDIPADVPQPGSAAQLASNDTRLTQSVAHADPDVGGALAVWTQHTIAPLGGGV